MPKIRKGESEDEYVNRCIPIVMKEKGVDRKEAAARCHGMYEQHKKKGTQYQEFTMSVPITIYKELKTEKIESDEDNKKVSYNKTSETRQAIAIVGDRFVKGNFLPAKELERVYSQWEGTLHDINHMGTTHLMGLGASSDIRFFVGYQKNVSYDEKTKEVSMDIHPIKTTLHYKTWKGYIDLCEAAGKTPNVSISFLGKVGTMKAKDLPEGVDYSAYGLDADDDVRYIYDIIPRALSTVLQGACNDKDGCGITNNKSDSCKLSDSEYEKKRQKLIKQLKKEEENNE